MNLNIYEKVVIIILMAALLMGSIVLLIKDRSPCKEIIIVKGGIEKRLTLSAIKKLHMEERKININKAEASDLVSIPSVGKVLASRIIEYRNLRGIFYDKKDLLGISGIGEKKLKKIEGYISIN